jgi:hypothetical protein
MSPAHSFTMSPGTSCWSGISASRPSRSTVAVTLIIALSFAAAASARDSWTNRRATPRININIITVAPLKSPVANETAARIPSKITRRLHAALKSRHSHPCCFSTATAFGPYAAMRVAAIVPEIPSAELCSFAKTAGYPDRPASSKSARRRSNWPGVSPSFFAAVVSERYH